MKPLRIIPSKWQTNVSILEADFYRELLSDIKKHRELESASAANAHRFVVKSWNFFGQKMFALFDQQTSFWDKDKEIFVWGQPHAHFTKKEFQNKLFPSMDAVEQELARIRTKFSKQKKKWILLDLGEGSE